MIPILNQTKDELTTRDDLGISSATNSLQDKLCPVITLETSRVFYWPFLVWNYYEYNKHVTSNRKASDFNKWFVKRNDYFFVLGNLLANTPDQKGMAGKSKTTRDAESQSPLYDYNTDYLDAIFGGMQYYNGGCNTVGFIAKVNNDPVPHVTQIGKPLALAFVNAVSNTEYYRNYRTHGDQIPKSVLEEWGNCVNLSMNAFTECKDIMKKTLFEPDNKVFNNRALIDSSRLVKSIFDEYGDISDREIRIIVFQDYYEKNANNTLPLELKKIANSWEIVVARQYLTCALETIWKRLMLCLGEPIPMDIWIENTINASTFEKLDINGRVSECLYSCMCSGIEIESFLASGRSSSANISLLIEKSIMVLFSIFNRFIHRADIDLSCGNDISIESLIELVNSFGNRTLKELIVAISRDWILNRHLIVAQNKMYQRDLDAYYFYVDSNLCYLKTNNVSPDIGGLRLRQLMSVMKDLDMLYE